MMKGANAMDNDFVTRQECQAFRNEILRENAQQTRDISKLYSATSAMSENIKNLVAQNKWFMGITGTVLGGLLVWLITKG